MYKRENKLGISLIVLVITILVMIILAGVVVVSLQKNNPIEKAKEATFKQDMASIGEELEMFCVNAKAQDGNFDKVTLNASKKNLDYNTKKDSAKNIYEIIPSLGGSKYKNQIEVIAGNLFYKTPNKKEIPWLRELGIHYIGIVTGTVKIEGDTLIGVSNDYVNTGTFIIPNTVKKIAPGAFAGCEDIYDVIIPEGITEIPDNCFRNCSNLASVQIPSTVRRIGVGAFRGCGKLNNVNLPASLTKIEEEGFYWCRSLTNVTFNDNLEFIGKKAFSYTSLTKVELKEKVVELQQQAFEEILAEKVILPESIQNIRAYAFYRARCKELYVGKNAKIEDGAFRRMGNIEKLTISKDNPYHASDNNAVYNKDMSLLISAPANVKNFVVPNTVKVIANSAFRQSRDLENVVIPEGVTTIGENVFEECYKLKAVHIPSTVTSIGIRLLEGCRLESPAALTVAANNSAYKAYNGAILSKDGTEILTVADVNTSFTIPDTVTKIRNSAFAKCLKMKEVVIPNQQEKSIEMDVDSFRETGLKNVTIPGSVKLVRWGAFRGSKELESVTFEEGVNTLHGSLFENCEKLTKIYIPSTVVSISGDLLAVTPKLDNIQVSKDNLIFKAVDNMILSKDGTALYSVSDAKKIVKVPSGVKIIVGYSFLNSYTIEEVRLPSSVTTIQENAFLFCRSLSLINIPSGCNSIASNAFTQCSSLSRIVIDKPRGGIEGAPWGAPQGTKAVIWTQK